MARRTCTPRHRLSFRPVLLLWNVFSQVLLPVLAMFGLGWVLDRKFTFDLNTCVKLNIYLFVPAFMFVHVVKSDLSGELALRVVGFTACIIASMFLLAEVIGRIAGYDTPKRRSMQMAAMFYNSANYGIPLMTLAFPQVGAVFQVFIVLVQNLTTFTVGLFLANSAHTGWRVVVPMLRQASIWAIIAAIAVRLGHVPVQQWRWLWVPLNYFSDGLVAMALVTLGVQLSKTEHRQPLGRISWALALRLLIAPLIAWALVPLFGFTGETARILIVSTSFPTAVNTALLAHEFKADSHFAAAAVFYSTMASMVTVTLLVAIVRMV